MSTIAKNVARRITQTNAVIGTMCSVCDAQPGYACWTDATGNAEVFHAQRLMDTDLDKGDV